MRRSARGVPPSASEIAAAAHRCHIVHIDDNPRDLELMQMAFDAVDGTPIAYSGITDPRHGLQQVSSASDPRPSLVLLDLNMPAMSGIQVLTRWRDDPRMQQIPVIVLTTSSSPIEHAQCLALGATAIMAKPLSFQELVDVAKSILAYC